MAHPVFALKTSGQESTNPLGLTGIDHFQLTGSLERLEPLYRRLGFARVASQTAPWGRMVHLRQQRMDILLLEADDSHQAGRYFATHGEGVCALNFGVEDLDAAMDAARSRGATVRQEPETFDLPGGRLRVAALQGVGDVWNMLVERKGEPDVVSGLGLDTTWGSPRGDEEGAKRPGGPPSPASDLFWPGLQPDPLPALCDPGLVRVDHLTNNVGPGEMDDLAAFYGQVYGFAVTREFHIRGALGTGLDSKVVQSLDHKIIIPINQPTDEKSQIMEYVRRHHGRGVQHIAMSTNDIAHTLRTLTAQGFRFLAIPDTYYELLPERIAAGGYTVREDLALMRDLRIQIDGDGTGYLLQLFTEDQIGPLFFEIIQRRGNMGFGEGNFQALFNSIELDQQRRGAL